MVLNSQIPFGLFGSKKVIGIGAKKFGGTFGKQLLETVIGRKLISQVARVSRTNVGLFLRQKFFNPFKRATITGRTFPGLSVDDIAEAVINEARERSSKVVKQTSKITKKVTQKLLPSAAERTSKTITKKTAPKVLNKTLQNSNGIFLKAMRNPAVIDAIIEKVGKEGAEKLGIKII